MHRRFLNWEWFKTPEMVQLFIYFLMKANLKSKNHEGIFIERGQLLITVSAIHQETKLSVQTIRTCIKRLISTNEITIKSTNKYSIISICNYDSYQIVDNSTNKQNNNLSNNQLTNKTSETNKQSKEKVPHTPYKENTEEINIPPIIPQWGKKIFNLDFVSPVFLDVFTEWLSYKKERGQSYKSERSLKICYKQLLSLSNNDPEIARDVVEQSIGSNYSGLFKLKNNGKSTSKDRYDRKRDDSQQRKLTTISAMERIREEASKRRRELEENSTIQKIS